MGDYFKKIEFKKHHLYDNSVRGVYPLSETLMVSICSGDKTYGKLDKVDYYILTSNKHSEVLHKIKSTFEVALINISNDEIELFESEEVLGDLTINDVEDFIKKVKQTYL